MKNKRNVKITKDGLMEKSTGRKIISPIDLSNGKNVGFVYNQYKDNITDKEYEELCQMQSSIKPTVLVMGSSQLLFWKNLEK